MMRLMASQKQDKRLAALTNPYYRLEEREKGCLINIMKKRKELIPVKEKINNGIVKEEKKRKHGWEGLYSSIRVSGS
jgi:hypothetical protein